MWSYTGVDNYLVHLTVSDNQLLLLCTDLVQIWKAEISLENLTRRFRELNPIFDMEDTAIVSKIKELYSKEGATHEMESKLQELKITSGASIGAFKYSFEVVLHITDNNMLLEEWTKPVLCMLKSMHDREQKLIEIIKSKETEIEQYKEEGAELKRKGVITAPFSQDDLKSSGPDEAALACPASVVCGPLQQLLATFLPKKAPVAVKLEPASPSTKTMREYQAPPPGPSISMMSAGVKKQKVSSRLRL